MRTVKTEMPPRPRAILLCAKCEWVKINQGHNLDWLRQRCGAAHVKDTGRLVKNENYGKPTGEIQSCSEWT